MLKKVIWSTLIIFLSNPFVEVILDLNLDKEHKYKELGSIKPSSSHRLVACSIDYEGHEDYTVHFREISSGKELDKLEAVTADVEWSEDDREVTFIFWLFHERSFLWQLRVIISINDVYQQ